MMKRLSGILAGLLATITLYGQASVEILPQEELRPIGPMNGMGAGPTAAQQFLYKAAGIPYARLHDVGNSTQHCIEVMHIFPNFDADENKAENYDFTISDQYIQRILSGGTQIIYRLKNTGHEPGSIKKYGAWPPKDFKKWARICEHIVRHYNDGWANGFHYNIRMWEIWNEPDMDQRKLEDGRWRYEVKPHSWGGTMAQYYDLFEITFKYLRKTHPDILIGGPANAEFEWNEPFLQEMQKRGVRVDFFTWHRYSRTPERLSDEGIRVRELLDRYGMQDVPTILDEWNYNYDWTPEGVEHSKRVRQSIVGAAYTAAVMCHMQDVACTDILTYYDFRPTTYNGSINRQTDEEMPTYYAFWFWNRLAQYGTQVKVACEEPDIYAVAAKNAQGKLRLMLVRFNEDPRVFERKTVYVTIPEGASDPICLLSDHLHKNTAYPFPVEDGKIKMTLYPNALVCIEF